MKIGLVIKQVSLSVGGAERFALNFAGTLARNGHEVHIFAASWDHEIPGVRYHRVQARRKPGWLNILLFHRNCRKILDRVPLDIVYGLTQTYPQDIFRMGGGIYRQWFRVRYPNAPLRWLHYLIRPALPVNLLMERKIFQAGNFHRIVANSEKCKKEVVRFHHIRPEQVDVVYNGVDHSVFHPGVRQKYRAGTRSELGVDEDRKLLLYAAASNWKRKGLDTLLKALIPFEDFLLIVVGKDKEQRYRRKVRRWGIEEKVRFLGFRKDIECYYAAADFLVLPTLYDPFSNVCLEAMACGLPVITSSGNGAAEIIENGVNGFILHDPRDHQELQGILESILHNDEWKRMGAAAHKTSLAFSLEENASKMLATCERVLREKAVPKVLSLKGIRWHYLSPAFAPRLEQWLDPPIEVELVKPSLRRRTLRHGEGIILKESFYSGMRAILRTLVGAKGCREGKILLDLARREVPVPEVLAFGTQTRFGILRRDILLTWEVRDAQNLRRFVKTEYPRLPFRLKRDLIEKFAGFIRKLHDKGVEHRDLHIGNILLRSASSEEPFILLDADRIRLNTQFPNQAIHEPSHRQGPGSGHTFRHPASTRMVSRFRCILETLFRRAVPGKGGLSSRAHLRNLALLFLNFWSLSSRGERMRFARYYRLDLKNPKTRLFLDRLEQATLEIAGNVWEGKARRCLFSNTRFQCYRAPPFRVLRVNQPGAESLSRALLPDPDRFFETGSVLKKGRTTQTSRVEFADGVYFLKRYNCKGWFYSLRNAFRRSRAVRSWHAAWELRERGVPVPEPILCLEERRFRLLKRSYLLSEFVEDARTLASVWPELQSEARRDLLSRLAIVLGRMHRAGAIHGDLKWSNILVSQGPRERALVLCDTDASRILPSQDQQQCRKDLDRFLRDLKNGGASHEEREFFEKTWARWSGIHSEVGTARGAGTILVRCPNWVGDVVMATPTFECLRRNFPEARILALVRRYARGVLEDAPWFDQILDCEDRSLTGFWKTVQTIRQYKPDLAVILPNSLRSASVARLAGIPTVVGYRRNMRSMLLSTGPKPRMVAGKILPLPMVEYYLDLCRWMGWSVPEKPDLRLFMSRNLEARADEILQELGISPRDRIIGINPGARFGSSKCWPPQYFARLADQFAREGDCKLLLLVGPGDDEIARSILETTRAPILDTGPYRVDLALLKPMIARCSLLVTNDTGPRHYAVALGVPTVVIMGPTDPRYTAANLERTTVLRENLDCSPCHKKVCPTDHQCMTRITPEMVYQAGMRLLEHNRP